MERKGGRKAGEEGGMTERGGEERGGGGKAGEEGGMTEERWRGRKRESGRQLVKS